MDSQQTNAEEQKPEVKASESPKVEVSASTVARMMGVATVTDIKLMEGKIDLLSTKVNAMVAKLERVATTIATLPTSNDFDRLDIQVGSVKTLMRELFETHGAGQQKESDAAQEQSKKLKESIRSTSNPTE